MDKQNSDRSGPRVSVVIPVFNGGDDFLQCVDAIYQSNYPIHECLLVDDASTDGMVDEVAGRFGSRVIRLEKQCGPGQARNTGVENAEGDIIFFTDADVLLNEHAIGEAVKALQAEPEVVAVFGSYDDQPGHHSFLSQYRNIFHHWVHQTGSTEASTFWTGCGAIRRDVFLSAGGFNDKYAQPSIEDIELGGRLRKSGHRIQLLKTMQGKHMKDWRFWNMVHTDIFRRGVPWMQLLLQEGETKPDLNLGYRSRIATLLAGFLAIVCVILPITGHVLALLPTLLFLLLATACSRWSNRGKEDELKVFFAIIVTGALPLLCYAWIADPTAFIPLFLIVTIVATHLPFYRYVAEKRNGAFATAVIPMQIIFFLGCALAIPIAFIKHHTGARKA